MASNYVNYISCNFKPRFLRQYANIHEQASAAVQQYIKDVKETVTPMEKADLPNARLSRFIWLYEERPASKEELFK